MTFAILKVLDLVMGLRVSREEEEIGIDASQHGERGYAFDVGGPGSVGIPQPAEAMASIAPVGQGTLSSVLVGPGGGGP
jgi:Amt family ammonium transporter